MINSKDLMIGNWALYEGSPYRITEIKEDAYTGHLSPIPLSPSVLEDCGFNKSSVENPFFSFYDLKLSRDREISVHNPGTPNEMVFISEQEGYKRKSVVVRNFDYDGKTYLHHLMNIHHSLTGTELIYKPKK